MLFLLVILTFTTLGACSGEDASGHLEPTNMLDSTGRTSRGDSTPYLTEHTTQDSSGQSLNLVFDQFSMAWGEEYHTGETDLAASAKLWSDGKQIHLSVNVIDDTVVLVDDPVHSDHVEVWFSMPQWMQRGKKRLTTRYIQAIDSTGNRRLFHYDDTVDLAAFKEEISNPMMYYDTPVDSEVVKGRRDSIYLAGLDFITKPFDKWLEDLREEALSQTYEFYGVTHWGLFPDRRPAFFYDRDRYAFMEQDAGVQFGMADFAPDYAVRETEQGYVIKAQFSPETLGFSFMNGLTNLEVMIDVVDVDHGERQQTLISTSSNRSWGDPGTFDQWKITPPLTVALLPGFASLGATVVKELSFRWKLPNFYVYTVNGWVGFGRGIDPVRHELYEYYEHISLPLLSGYSFSETDFQHLTFERAGNIAEVIRLPGEPEIGRPDDHLLLNGKELEYKDSDYGYEVLDMFVFPDSTVGFLQLAYDYVNGGCLPRGMCGCGIDHTLKLLRVDAPDHVSVYNLLYKNDCFGELNLADSLVVSDFYEGIELTKEDIRWHEAGRRFSIQLGAKTVEFEWNGNGENVRVELVN